MKILHAVQGWPPEHLGGTELYVQRLARVQAAAGHEVAIAAGSTSDRYDGAFRRQSEDAAGLAVHRISQRGTFSERWDHGSSPYVENAFARLLDELQPDLVHVHHWLRLTRTLVHRTARAGIPAVLTLHDAAATCPRLFRVRPEEAFCELPPSVASCLHCVPRESWATDEIVAEQIDRYNADLLAELEASAALIAPSAAHARLIARFSGLPEERFEVVPHAASVPWEHEPGEAWTPASGRPLRLAHWGNLLPFKGVHILLEALALLDRSDEVELVLWGRADDAEYDKKLSGLLRGLRVERTLAFDAERLAELCADVAVFPTLAHESHSFVLDEAFALRLPVLVSNRGALPERCGAGGLSFQPGEPAGLAKRIEDVLDGKASLQALRDALPHPAGIAEHWARLETIYTRALEREAPQPAANSAEDRQRWERLARALEARARELIGLQQAAEREVGGLRKDVSDIFSKMHEERAELAAKVVEVKSLEGRVGERVEEIHALEARAAEERRAHDAQLADKAHTIAALEARVNEINAERIAEVEAIEGRFAEALREHLERENRLWGEIVQRDHRLRKLGRENMVAMPLVLPARGLLWLWDKFEGLFTTSEPQPQSQPQPQPQPQPQSPPEPEPQPEPEPRENQA